MEISKVKQLARVVLVLKLLLLSLILAICAHKALSLNCVQSDLTACEQQAQWWTLSTSALLCEGVLAVLGAALVLCMLAQVSKVALELRFRTTWSSSPVVTLLSAVIYTCFVRSLQVGMKMFK